MPTPATRPDEGAASWRPDWAVGLRVWVERAGRAILGKGRLELLEGIDRSHSISAAARQMGMSYRRAWELVQSINAAAGEPLVVAATGGTHGGGVRLTPLGLNAVAVFRDLQAHVGRAAAAFLPQRVPGGGATTLHAVAAVSLEEVLGRLAVEYALRQPRVRVRTVFGASDELADHLLAGGPGDLFLSADPGPLQQLRKAGLLLGTDPVTLAENGLAAIAPADVRLPVRKPADLVCPQLARIALAAPDCPLGRYTHAYLQDAGLFAELAGRAVWLENSRAVVTAVRSGRAEAGIVYGSDALSERRLPAPVPRPPPAGASPLPGCRPRRLRRRGGGRPAPHVPRLRAGPPLLPGLRILPPGPDVTPFVLHQFTRAPAHWREVVQTWAFARNSASPRSFCVWVATCPSQNSTLKTPLCRDRG